MPERTLHSALGTPFIELQSVDSTNNYALTLVHAGLAQAGTAIFAHQQSAGKGQRGKSWSSEKGKTISLSLIINPRPLQASQQFRLSACVAVAVCRIMTRYLGDECRIKWPNDIYWQDRKAGGILIESVVKASTNNASSWKWAIAGIGINVNQSQFPPELNNAVSMKQVTGRSFIPVEISREICKELDQALNDLSNDGFNKLFTAFNQLLYKRGELIRLKKDNRNFEALLKGVSETGELVVEHGIEQRYKVGEASLLPPGTR